jgi:hypothetical protein
MIRSMKLPWAVLAAAIGIGCAQADALIAPPEPSLRPEGAWTGEQLDAVAGACAEWARYMRRGKACWLSPSGEVRLVRETPFGIVQMDEDPRIDTGSSPEPATIRRAVLHAMAIVHGFSEDDTACASSSRTPANSTCGEHVSPLDVARCRAAGACA